MARLFNIIDKDPDRVGEFVGSVLKTTGWSPFTAIGLEKHGKLIAGVVYDNYNDNNIFAHIAIKGMINREFLWYMCHYPFMELGVDRVSGMVNDTNKEVIRFVEHLGAFREATLRHAHPNGDVYIYCLFKKDCKYLRGN